jgi:hypothetical protein
MKRLKKERLENEGETFIRLFEGRTYDHLEIVEGKIISVESDDVEVINFVKRKGLL